MSNDADMTEVLPTGFLNPGDTPCPPDLLARAATTTPPSFVFVRATGKATLITARDALDARLARPILVGKITKSSPMLLPLAGTLRVLKLSMRQVKTARLMRPWHCLPLARQTVLPKNNFIQMCLWVVLCGVRQGSASINVWCICSRCCRQRRSARCLSVMLRSMLRRM